MVSIVCAGLVCFALFVWLIRAFVFFRRGEGST
jgi:hypothetical protein